MLGEPLDAFALAGVLAVKALGVELLVEAEGLDLAVEPREVGRGGRGEVEPGGACGAFFELGGCD